MKAFTKKISQSLAAAAVVASAVSMMAMPVQARDLNDIRNDVFQVVNSGAYPPFSFVDIKGNLVGFDVDIAKALAEKMGVEVNVQSSPWNGIIAAMVGGRFDACICSMSDTEERRKAVTFTDPYYSAGLAVWVTGDTDDVNGLGDFSGKRVGSTLGETGNQWAVENANGNWRNQTFQGLPDMMNGLTTGRIDIMIADDVPVMVAIRENDADIKMVDVGKLPRFPAAISIQKNKPELLAALNTALAEIKADGTYQSVVDKWIGVGANIE
ncbi:transporter substrate-binding domain-containing protein [Marinomonas primoryensis]|uniref:Amino acid ABC transporter substrate-binding protein n=1 Tax=Marinomonas primoryensis TaxID=178399 RepID=A0A859CYY0_9GAMM|nr:transporter substrate-binding domain-containing protein [Marinomonas primoryensis]QKK81797.1 amino acid ABC transporter substrate-binding protein [Marinomonas primoryensis]